MADSEPALGGWNARMTGSVIRLATWTGAWLVTMALATFGPGSLWNAEWLTLLAILINLSIGLAMIGANVAYLRVIDEMMQRVQLEAMGLALGIGVVVGLSYALLDGTGLISSDAEIGHVILLIGITYLTSVILGVRKYR